jgi:hypothetical protein
MKENGILFSFTENGILFSVADDVAKRGMG